MRRTRALVVLVALLATLVAVGASAASAAPTIPFVPDCKDAPAPAEPGVGATDVVDPPPAKTPVTGDAFADPAHPSIYNYYGYAGPSWHTYDLGCVGAVQGMGATLDTTMGNFLLGAASWETAVANGLHNTVSHPERYMSPLDHVVTTVTRQMRASIWSPWGVVALLGLGAMLLWMSMSGRIANVVSSAAWAVLVLAVLAGVTAYPERVSSFFDHAVTGAIGSVNAGAAQVTGVPSRGDPARAQGALLVDNVLYAEWLRGEFGSANSRAAQRWGPALFKASTMTWHEADQAAASADAAKKIADGKAKQWKDTTAQIQDQDPATYAHLRDAGRLPKAGARWTVGQWLDHWLRNIAQPSLRESSYEAYRTAVEKYLVPGLGKHRLDKLEPEHLERLYRTMTSKGLSPGYAHQVHRTARTALGEAHRRGHVSRNVAQLAKAPRVRIDPVEPYSVAEVQAILRAASDRRNSTRWAVALALGLRQGETLGLRWVDVDLATQTLRVRSTWQRPRYEHGCGGLCGRKAGFCPDRRQTNQNTGQTKSAAGRRVIGLPGALVVLLQQHRNEQDRERRAAAQLWEEGGWVFANEVGRPINPNTDYRAWKDLLKTAGVRDGRLHDARHTAATVLLVLGIPERTVMSVMGWSSTSMAARYQHVTDPIRRDVAERIGGLLWAPEEGSNEPG